jgi:hypothetical protein
VPHATGTLHILKKPNNVMMMMMIMIIIIIIIIKSAVSYINHLTPELNPSAQRRLPRFFTGDINF